MIEEEEGDQGVFIGKDTINGGIMLEMNVVNINTTAVSTYQNWMNPEDGRLYYISPDYPNEKKRYLLEGDVSGGSGSTYTGAKPLNISSSGVISIDTAGSGVSGALSASDWAVFNNKFSLPSGGTDGHVLIKSGSTAVWAAIGSGGPMTGSAPISISGSNISIATASASQTGALSSTDWTTFNNKFSLPGGGADGNVLVKSGSTATWQGNFIKDGGTVNSGFFFNSSDIVLNNNSIIHFGSNLPNSNAATAQIYISGNELILTTTSAWTGDNIVINAAGIAKIRGRSSSNSLTEKYIEVEIGGSSVNNLVKINGIKTNFYRSSTPADGAKFVLQYDSISGVYNLMPA